MVKIPKFDDLTDPKKLKKLGAELLESSEEVKGLVDSVKSQVETITDPEAAAKHAEQEAKAIKKAGGPLMAKAIKLEELFQQLSDHASQLNKGLNSALKQLSALKDEIKTSPDSKKSKDK